MFLCVFVQPERCSQAPLRPYFGLFSVSGFCMFAPVLVMRRRGIPVSVMPLFVARFADFCRCSRARPLPPGHDPSPIFAGWPFVFLGPSCLPACPPACPFVSLPSCVTACLFFSPAYVPVRAPAFLEMFMLVYECMYVM